MRNGIFRHIALLCSLLPLFLTACQEEGQMSKGKGRLILGDVEISIEAETRAFSLPELDKSNIIIDIIDPLGDIIETGNLDHYKNGVELFAATYTVKAHYGTRLQMSTTPYYEGTASIVLTENETENVSVTVSLANAIIIPNIPQDLISHYNTAPTFYVAYNEEEISVANEEALYVLPGDTPYILSLKGQNKANVDIVKNIGSLNVEAKMVYNINCNTTLPTLTLPEQQNGAWAKRLYITPAIAKDSKDNIIPTPQGIIYEIISASTSDWSTATSIQSNDNQDEIIITKLTENTKYKIRARLGDKIITTPVSFTTETSTVIPNGNLDQSSITAGADNDKWGGGGGLFGSNGRGAVYEFYSDKNETNSWWRTNNSTKCPSNKGYIYSWSSRSGTRPDSDAKNGQCARIMTSGYGIKGGLLTASGSPSHIAIGRLFTDKISFSHSSRPSALAFYYKYTPKGNDAPIISIKIYNGEDIIGDAQLAKPYHSEYQEEKVSLDINYHGNFRTPATHLEIIFESGSNTEVSKFHNNTDDAMPMFIGSQLYIDEVELIYE